MGINAKPHDSDLEATLTNLLLPIGRLMLKGGLGVGDLIRAAKHAYVRAAIAHVLPAGSRPNASRLSVITGLTRKEVAAIVSELKGSNIGRAAEVKEQRAIRVLRGWSIDPRFSNGKGDPARLPLKGDRKSFTALVKIYGGDVTPNSVLKELERMRVVTLTRSGELNCHPARIHPRSTHHMSDLVRLFSDFAATVSQERPTIGPQLFFGFRDSVVESADQAGRFQRTFSNRAAVLLQSVEQWLASQGQNETAKPVKGIDQCRVGIGVYMVQGMGHSQRGGIKTSRRRTQRSAQLAGRD